MSTPGHSRDARLFVALWPDAATRSALAAYRDTWRWAPGTRLVADTDLHLTLHFIGALARDRLPDLRSLLSTVPPRTVGLVPDGVAMWQRGTAVLLMRGDAALAALHDEIGAALRAAGVPLEARPFAPHVTLARAAGGTEPPTVLPDLAWSSTSFVLVESTGAAPSAYRMLAG